MNELRKCSIYTSTKLEKKAELVLSGSEGDEGRGRRRGTRGRNGPSNVCTYE
jgi:hypothetical protein